MAGFISESDAAILNAARDVLKKLEDAARTLSYGDGRDQAFQLGRFAEACDGASGAVFNALNVASAYLRDEVAQRAVRA